ncbi:SLC13 family permease [Halococcus hamelinensis]|uniref:Citrate transporter n=1 Tax=Halococcus hamelinensis 100A6 TaxID=1132509 RepID=M0M7S2_9EURY|nr:SLC13 family permease [Halococcus hamelinensis]EMA40659.1 citrate transporter [Halococcus hamelinensis 100A6]
MLRATTPDLLVAAVVVATFLALAVPRVRGVPLSRALTAGLGAVAVVALGGLSPEAAFASVDPTTLLLVFGMLVHVEALSTSGVYGWAAAGLANRAATTRRLTLGAACLAAGLSAVALNDATVILLAPVVLDAAATADADPTLPGVGLVVGANVGSLATPLGNPQNAYILARSAVSAGEFVRRLAPVAVVCLGLALLVLVPFTDRRRLPPVPEPSFDRGWAALGGGFLVGTLLLLVALPDIDAGALAAGTALTHLGAVQVGRRVPADEVLERLDWGVLVLFVGLFVLTGAIRGDAVFVALLNTVEGAGVAGRAAAAFGLSAVVSNVPAVLLLAPVTVGETEWLRLAAVSTLAGNATPVASAATLIVLERARRSGQRLSVPRLVAIGLPISVLTTLVAVVLV